MLRTPFFYIKTQIRIINACFVLPNFIIEEKQKDLELLSAVDEELTNQQMQRVGTNGVDEVASVQVTEEWTAFHDAYAKNMFVEYKDKSNIS